MHNFFFLLARAAETAINPVIPGTTTSSNPIELIAGLYKFALSVSGLLAIAVIVYGAVKYAANPGNAANQSDAKDWITSALLGILLLAGAYIILYTINPDLTILRLPTLKTINTQTGPSTTSGNTYACLDDNGKILGCYNNDCGSNCASTRCVKVTSQQCSDFSGNGGEFGGAGATGGWDCEIPPLTPLTADALQLKNSSDKVLWTSSDPSINSNLQKLQAAVNKMQGVLTSKGASMTVTSAYRPIGYQQYLWELVDRWITQNLKGNTEPVCADFKTAVGADYAARGLGTVVAKPSICAPHVRGIGVDIKLSGYSYNDINTLLSQNGIQLRWQGLADDQVHFNLQNPPFTPPGC